jgi:hypothetical protein
LSDSGLARRLWWAALDQEAELRLDSALALLRAARAADPDHLPAQHDYLRLMIEQGREGGLRGDPVLGPCVHVLSIARRQGAYQPPLAMSFDSATPCGAALVTLYARLRLPLTDELGHLEAAARAAPELWQAWEKWSTVLTAARRHREAQACWPTGRRAPATHTAERWC